MKSSFLFIALFTAMTTSVAFAQMSTMPSPKDMQPETSFEKFNKRLKIGYFGVFTSPHFDDLERNDWDNAAISPEWGMSAKGDGKNHDTWPANMWNQVSFNYNFGWKMNFVVNPRFMVPLTHPVSMKPGEHRALVQLDDFLIGVQGVVVSSEDKSFNLWVRPGMRIPTSRTSRNGGNGGAGTITHQAELAYLASYDFNPTWQVALFGQFRQWVIEDQYGFDRFRIFTGPYVQYTANDTTKVQLYYNNILETDRRAKKADDRDPVFKDRYQDVMVGVAKDVTPSLNVMPYLSVLVADRPITDKSLYIGAWISYQIK